MVTGKKAARFGRRVPCRGELRRVGRVLVIKSFGIARGPRRRCRVCDIGNRDPAGLKDLSAGSDSAAGAHFSNAGSAMNEGTAKIRAATADIQAATG
ncbi:MAG TPA: hypothetical protein VGD83_07590 [Streptosporangiaceae bacterium]